MEDIVKTIRKAIKRETTPREMSREELRTEIFDLLHKKIPDFDNISGTLRLVNKRRNEWITTTLKNVIAGKEVTLEMEGPLEPGASFATRVVFHPDNSLHVTEKSSWGYINVEEGEWGEILDEKSQKQRLADLVLSLRQATPQDEPKTGLRIRAPDFAHLAGTVAKQEREEKKRKS